MARKYDYDFICIGSGPACQRAAIQAAKKNKRVAVIEKNGAPGGVCLHTGTIPSKTFREAVLALPNGRNPFSHRGRKSNGGQRPTADTLLKRVNHIEERETWVLEDQLDRNRVEMIHGAASFKDAHTIHVNSTVEPHDITAEKILIGVGTNPARPADVPLDGRSVITSDEILELEELPRSMVVIGCGVIGIEYASMFATFGVDVTAIDARDRPLEFLDHEVVDELIHQMRNRNVKFRLGERVDHIDVSKNGQRRAVVHLESGKRVVADVALYAIGRSGATDSLDLAAAGLQADNRGRIKVDDRFRTEVPNIYAAGDVIGFPSLACTSSEQGRLAACHAFGVKAGRMADHFPIGIYSIPEISTVGQSEEELTRNKVPYESGVARYREIARGQILGDDSGFLKMLFHRKTRRLLGVQVIGTGATELVHIGQTVLGLGGGLDYLMGTIFNYPTLAECYKVAAFDAYNKMNA
jgi:NAD(P) transhydrogenase